MLSLLCEYYNMITNDIMPDPDNTSFAEIYRKFNK